MFHRSKRFTLARALSKLCLLSVVHELKFGHRSFAIVSLVSSHTQTSFWLAHTHSWCIFWVRMKLYWATLGGKVASQSKFINVWNISSLIFAPVHSSDFAWWWCIIKCWNNTTISAYELLFLFLFFSHSKTAHFNWLGLFRICHKWTVGCPHAIVYNSSHTPTT